jgi:hypothetical protein
MLCPANILGLIQSIRFRRTGALPLRHRSHTVIPPALTEEGSGVSRVLPFARCMRARNAVEESLFDRARSPLACGRASDVQDIIGMRRPRSRRGSSNNPGVAELADAHDSKSCGRKAVMVRPHSPGPKVHTHLGRLFSSPTGTCEGDCGKRFRVGLHKPSARE